MRLPRLRTAFVALCALAGLAMPSALADGGSVSIRIVKAGFVIGGSAGSGNLNFHGRNYRLSIGGLSYGFTFGGSIINFHGFVTNIRGPRDVAGVYAAGGVGAAAGDCVLSSSFLPASSAFLFSSASFFLRSSTSFFF